MPEKAKQIKEASKRSPLRLLYQFFTSFKLATVVLILMTIVTLLGTLGQVDLGLHAAKEKYFHSWFFIERIGGLPILLPGGLLLMIILFTNMIFGALIKVRKRWRGAGLLISHSGMLMLLAGGWITWAIATDGYMALYPGMSSSRVESYRDWQLEVYPLNEEGEPETAFILPAETLRTIKPDQKFVADTTDLPFDVVVNGFAENSTPIPVSAPIAASATGKEIDGFKLSPKKKAKEEAMNLPGAYVEFRPKGDSAEPVEAILWAGSYKFDPRNDPMPFRFEIGGEPYAAMLAKKSWNVPFEVTLDEFIFEKHPGISTARNYESRVTRREEGEEDKPLEIKMNEPMRYAGYTFFQESFGPAGSQPGDEMYSQFAVANNPADQWPLWALIVTGIGLGIHFVIMLIDYILRSRRKRAAKTT